MKTFWVLLISVIFYSCCKCDIGPHPVSLRYINGAGEDLVFGVAKVYDTKDIKFYSISGTDTIFHYSAAILYSGQADSVIIVGYNYQGSETSFVSFPNGDIDTLTWQQNSSDRGCCKGETAAYPVQYNGKKITSGQVNTVTK